MPATLDDGGFESGAGWSVVGNADAHQSGASLGTWPWFWGPHSGSFMGRTRAYMDDGSCGPLPQGRLAATFTVAPADEGFYVITGFFATPGDLVCQFGAGLILDGVDISAHAGIGGFGGRWFPWSADPGGGFLLLRGTHTLAFYGVVGPLALPFGGPCGCGTARDYFWDDIGLVLVAPPPPPPPPPPKLRLTHAPGGPTQRLTVHESETIRVTYNG